MNELVLSSPNSNIEIRSTTSETEIIPLLFYNSKTDKAYSESSSRVKDICYEVENKDIWSYKSQLLKHSDYFNEVFSSLTTTKKHYRILLPKWVKQPAFSLFMNFLETEVIRPSSLEESRQLLWIADFFKSQRFIGIDNWRFLIIFNLGFLLEYRA